MSLQGTNIYRNSAINNTTIPHIGEFRDTSTNTGNVSTAYFYDNAVNNSNVTDSNFTGLSINNSSVRIASFNQNATNALSGLVTDSVFNDTASNNGTFTRAVFNNAAVNNAGSNGDTAEFNDSSINNGAIIYGTFKDDSINTVSGTVENAVFNDSSINRGSIISTITLNGNSFNENISVNTNRDVYYWLPAASTPNNKGVTYNKLQNLDDTQDSYWKEVSPQLSAQPGCVAYNVTRYGSNNPQKLITYRGILTGRLQDGVLGNAIAPGSQPIASLPVHPCLFDESFASYATKYSYSGESETRTIFLTGVTPNAAILNSSATEILTLGLDTPVIYAEDLLGYKSTIKDRYSVYERTNSVDSITPQTPNWYTTPGRSNIVITSHNNSIVRSLSGNIQAQYIHLSGVRVIGDLDNLNNGYIDGVTLDNVTLSSNNIKLSKFTPLSKLRFPKGIANSTIKYKGTISTWDWRATKQPTTTYPQLIGGDNILFNLKPTLFVSSGKNLSGEAGVEPTDPNVAIEPVTIYGNWKKIVVGKDFTVGIKTDNTLWGWGSNEYGQLGVDPAVLPYTYQPHKIVDNSNIWDVAAGDNHILFTTWDILLASSLADLPKQISNIESDITDIPTSTYTVYGLGDNRAHQIANILEDVIIEPQFVTQGLIQHDYTQTYDVLMQSEPPEIVAGGNNSAFSSYSPHSTAPFTIPVKKWHMFGDNVFKQLGVTEEDAIVEADKLYIGKGMILIQRFNTQTAGGTLLGRGRNLYSMLYLSTNAIVDTFEVVDGACTYKYISISGNRVVALTHDNQIFTWGRAIDKDAVYNSPQPILNDPVDEWAYVAAGNLYIAALNTDGDTYLLGTVF